MSLLGIFSDSGSSPEGVSDSGDASSSNADSGSSPDAGPLDSLWNSIAGSVAAAAGAVIEKGANQVFQNSAPAPNLVTVAAQPTAKVAAPSMRGVSPILLLGAVAVGFLFLRKLV